MARGSTLVGPRGLVAIEALRAIGNQVLSPLRGCAFALSRARHAAEIERDLGIEARVEEPPPFDPPDRPLRVFVSCAEPSGEAHAAGTTRALAEILAERGAPPPELTGLGGEALRAAGVRLVGVQSAGDPVSRAAMGTDAAASYFYYVALLTEVARHLRSERPDACLLVDSPALHVPLARIARSQGVPVAHLATPQYWSWAPWRVRAYRAVVDRALTILPFEPAWFARRGVRVAHVGHPELDRLQGVPARREEGSPRSRPLVLLPGSRPSVIRRNLPWMIAAASRLRLTLTGLPVVVAHERPELLPLLEECVRASGASEWIEIDARDLHGRLAGAGAALSVSGTILIDLLHHRLPVVVVYRVASRIYEVLAPHLLALPWISSINLLVGRPLVAEHVFHGEGPLEEVTMELTRLFEDPAHRAACIDGLEEALARLGPPGATRRAAGHVGALASARAREERA